MVMDVPTLVRSCRQEAGLSQRQLAERAGTSAAAVSLYEGGVRVPRTDTLIRLIAAAGATLSLRAEPAPPGIDLVANGRDLEDLLELADNLPQRSSAQLEAPPFARLVS